MKKVAGEKVLWEWLLQDVGKQLFATRATVVRIY